MTINLNEIFTPERLQYVTGLRRDADCHIDGDKHIIGLEFTNGDIEYINIPYPKMEDDEAVKALWCAKIDIAIEKHKEKLRLENNFIKEHMPFLLKS